MAKTIRDVFVEALDEEDARRDRAGEYFKQNGIVPDAEIELPELNPDGSEKN